MANLNMFSCLFLLLLCFNICKGDWCIVKYTVSNVVKKSFIESACSKLDCSAIKPGGPCYEPDTLTNHASYVLNLDYRKNKVCREEIGTIALTDPSYDNCRYT
ncbi:Glucan endo-1,3-beta-glucosidase 13 [Sesamum alatum]|uniref:Glucan endo-1,3-beta-glucosidase 13 n=1 Tax=Sesamum alatum TaxID=300844 RepID=A0AAE1Z348_9LAMI|nr:Glucan endo-1,3-beta-glucosidase 13 [Sesamum alatum]